MATVLISGGSGLIGQHLSKMLVAKGYTVSFLSRSPNDSGNIKVYAWDWKNGKVDDEAIKNAEYIVHLAGAGIAEKRWTEKRKKVIIDSRVKTGEFLYNKTRELNPNLKAFITSSAIGYYGMITSEKVFDEADPTASDFFGITCSLWEKMADKFGEAGIRTVKIRTGVVLTKRGGALEKMLAPVRRGLGASLGSGKQYLPWIHMDDLCSIYIKAIEDTKMEGPYNAVAPQFTNYADFNQTAAKMLNKPLWLPNIPGFVLRLAMGEMAGMVLEGSRVSADKIQQTGFKFSFPDLEEALTDLL
ncbi:MAG: TIGR01777 family oxidoreductase [Bacteroidales bacterium]|nr:TIGR01777 family oxidoreductase [Bacteroidales bacterium]MCF8402370.1 TIGR01777 family oxidoreductase [Bacteroidales bacterium]